MTKTKVLFHYISLLRDLFVPLNLYLGKLRGLRILSHYPIFDSVEIQKRPVRLSKITFIRIYLFDRVFCMTARQG